MRQSKSRSLPIRPAFTLIEMFVVIVIIAVLLALLLPAIQSFRESAARAQCLNNLNQMSRAVHSHEDLHKYYPSAGWGWLWLGCPHRGNGPEQPGGWAYNLLPFLERNDLRRLGYGKTGTDFIADMNVLVNTPIAIYNCPTRRSPIAFPNGTNFRSADANGVMQTFTPPKCVRSDYAGCIGNLNEDERGPGPGSVAQGDTPTFWTTTPNYSNRPLPNGIFFQQSNIQRIDITRGLSNVYLIGERHINPNYYMTAQDPSDNESFYAGYNNDICRTAAVRPRRDTIGVVDTFAFGSAHKGGFQMAFCDGSVRFIEYNIALDVHSASGNRFAK